MPVVRNLFELLFNINTRILKNVLDGIATKMIVDVSAYGETVISEANDNDVMKMLKQGSGYQILLAELEG